MACVVCPSGLTNQAHPQPRKNLPRLPTTQKYESANHHPQNCGRSGCWVRRIVRRMAHIWWLLLQWHHQSYFSMTTAHHQPASSSLAPNTSSGQSWLLVAHLYEMKLSQEPDTESDYSYKPSSPESAQNLQNESSPTSPSAWSRAEDAYLESRLRILQASLVATTPRTRRRNRKSSPIARAAKRRIYAAARLCWKTIRSIGQRLCQLKPDSLRVIWRPNSPCANPSNDPSSPTATTNAVKGDTTNKETNEK
jgi:hypothetical protein